MNLIYGLHAEAAMAGYVRVRYEEAIPAFNKLLADAKGRVAQE